MDVNLVRTFMAVATTRSFVAAGQTLHLTQSAISFRIQKLEDLLGQTLFERSKAGVKLTHAGHQFEPMARNFMQLWSETRFNVSLPERYNDTLSLACEESLWPELSSVWLAALQDACPATAFRFEVSTPDAITNLLRRGLVDVAVLYNPQVRAGFEVEKIMEDRLILVSGDATARGPTDANYIYMDWGPEFALAHARWYPDMVKPQITMRIGPGLIKYLIANKKCAYLPHRIADDYIDEGRLFWMVDEPVMEFPAYSVKSAEAQSETVETAISELRLAAENAPWIDIETG